MLCYVKLYRQTDTFFIFIHFFIFIYLKLLLFRNDLKKNNADWKADLKIPAPDNRIRTSVRQIIISQEIKFSVC